MERLAISLLLVSSFQLLNAKSYVICVSSEDYLAEQISIANYLTTNTADTWSAVNSGSLTACRDMLRKGEANLYETDAGKAYGILLDSAYNAWEPDGMPVGKVGNGYTTMAVARASKIVNDSITSFCDIADRGTWRAGHTGFMKTAGWVSPMGALQECAASRPTLQDACRDLTQTGDACHQSAFASSCVPGIPGGVATDPICAQCTNGTHATCALSPNSYYGYAGAAKCLLDGACDVAFMKSSTMNCPAGGYCQSIPAPGVVDAKSVYANGFNVTGATFQAIPGYGQYMPSHVVLAFGVDADSIPALRAALEVAYPIHNGDIFYPATVTTDTASEDGTLLALEQMLGAPFVQTMRNMPYFYEHNLLIRPDDETEAWYGAETGGDGDSDGGMSSGTTAAVVTCAVAFVALAVFVVLLVVKEKQGNPMFYEPVEQKPPPSEVAPAGGASV